MGKRVKWKTVPSCWKKDVRDGKAECQFAFEKVTLKGFKWCGQNLVVKGARCKFKYYGISSSVEVSANEGFPEHSEIIMRLKVKYNGSLEKWVRE